MSIEDIKNGIYCDSKDYDGQAEAIKFYADYICKRRGRLHPEVLELFTHAYYKLITGYCNLGNDDDYIPKEINNFKFIHNDDEHR